MVRASIPCTALPNVFTNIAKRFGMKLTKYKHF
jgi:hypothetical protein